MSVVAKLTCPECGKVLRPAKPVTVGKKVKCPRCENVFTARSPVDDEDEAEATPRKGKAKPASTRKSKAGGEKPRDEPKPAKAGAEVVETYGYIKDETEEDEEKKPKINYAPDTSIKDLRGPATAKCITPSNYLLMAGSIGALGWLGFILLLVIPAVFPLEDKGTNSRPAPGIGKGLSAVNPFPRGFGGGGLGMITPPPGEEGAKKKVEEEEPSFFEIWGMDLALVGAMPMYLFLPSLIPLIAGALYCAVCAMGAVRMQNIESRGWGITASVLAMLPFNVGGVCIILALVVQFILRQIEMDAGYTNFLIILFCVLAWIASLGAGVYALMTLMDEDVIAGFEYEPD
jgi:phage FluMu protein Com